MADDPSNEIQSALITALKADPGVAALVGSRVYDWPPENVAFPYIVLGDDELEDSGCHTQKGAEVLIPIHIWSQARGRKEAKQIAEAIYDRLHEGSLSLTGHDLVLMRRVFATTFRDEDGVTHHGVSRFRIITRRQA